MPRWRRTGEGDRKTARADPAAGQSPSAPAPSVEPSAELATPTPLARQVDAATPAPAPGATPSEPRGPERGGELELSLAANHDGGISKMSLVGAEGGLRQTAWIFAEGERMANNESEAIAQRVVDSAAIPLSFQPESFYESLASLTSYREQGGFDDGALESTRAGFSSLSEATRTYPPFGSPQTRGASANSPAFDAQPTPPTVQRAVDARFSSQTAPPPASSGLVFDGSSFSAPEPAPRPAAQRANARWAADEPAALPTPSNTPAELPPLQRLADRGQSSPVVTASPATPESVRPASATPVTAAAAPPGAPADLSLATPAPPDQPSANRPPPSSPESPSTAQPVQRSAEAAAPPTSPPVASPAVEVDAGVAPGVAAPVAQPATPLAAQSPNRRRSLDRLPTR